MSGQHYQTTINGVTKMIFSYIPGAVWKYDEMIQKQLILQPPVHEGVQLQQSTSTTTSTSLPINDLLQQQEQQ